MVQDIVGGETDVQAAPRGIAELNGASERRIQRDHSRTGDGVSPRGSVLPGGGNSERQQVERPGTRVDGLARRVGSP